MIDFKIDFSAFERKAKELHAAIDQVPYALALAMTEAANAAKDAMVADWPQHVHQRNPSFIKRALQVRPAKKHDLTVEIYDSLGRAHLKMHAVGGTKQATGSFAIPTTRNVKRGARGVPKGKYPRSLANSFVADLRGKGPALWVRYGRKNRRLRLMYELRKSTPVKQDVPFYQDFATVMARELRISFPAALARAMKTRRPR